MKGVETFEPKFFVLENDPSKDEDSFRMFDNDGLQIKSPKTHFYKQLIDGGNLQIKSPRP